MIWTKEEYNKAVTSALRHRSFIVELNISDTPIENIYQIKQWAQDAGHVATINGVTMSINIFPGLK